MNISDNILKEQLKNVYFLSGGAYGGKTTMAKLIEKNMVLSVSVKEIILMNMLR